MRMPYSVIILTVVLLASVQGTAFNCKNSLISDQWREMVLNFHNNKRRLLQEGKQPCQGGVAPWGKDIKELHWDCDLEYYAHTQNCGGTVAATYMSNVQEFTTNAKCNINSSTTTILKKWWDQAKNIDLAASQQYVPGLENFAPMAAAEATGFACTYDPCTSSQSKLLCIYNKVLQINADNIYTAGASAAEICQTCAQQNKCTASLCQEDYTPAGDIPQRACMANDGLTNDLETIAVDMHNYYRRQIATGWMVDNKGGYAPTAKAMPALTYDCAGIGAKAKAKADPCPSTNPGADPGYSMNYYYVANWTAPKTDLLRQAIKQWAEQVSTVGVGKNNIYTANAGVDYYANMANDQATSFGCAVGVCTQTGGSAVVCEYDSTPQTGDPIYTTGKTCAGCTAKGQTCQTPLGGLCV